MKRCIFAQKKKGDNRTRSERCTVFFSLYGFWPLLACDSAHLKVTMNPRLNLVARALVATSPAVLTKSY